MMEATNAASVHVVVDLPQSLAADVEEARKEDPDFLRHALRYAVARRLIFEELRTPEARAS